jgi:DNA transposition AAA+ family ATPase
MSNTIDITKHRAAAADEIEEVRSTIAAEVAGGVSLRVIAEESGVPYGTLSAFVKGAYAGRNDNVAERLRPWISSQGAKAKTKKHLAVAPGFLMTPSAASIMDTLEFAQHAPDMVLITGAPGVGKTMTIEAYAEGSPNVWVLTADASIATPRQVLVEVADLCGVLDRGRASANRLSSILTRRLIGSGGLIIVDEAQKLKTEAMDQLRALHDRAQIGIALVGNNTVKTRLEGGSRGEEFAQLFSRIGMRVNRQKPTKRDVAILLDAWNLQDDFVRKRAEEIAREPGALRGMTKALRIAHMTAARSGLSAPTEKHLNAAWASISGYASAP